MKYEPASWQFRRCPAFRLWRGAVKEGRVMANKDLKNKPTNMGPYWWWYEESGGIYICHDINEPPSIGPSGSIGGHVKGKTIPWRAIRAALRRKDKKRGKR